MWLSFGLIGRVRGGEWERECGGDDEWGEEREEREESEEAKEGWVANCFLIHARKPMRMLELFNPTIISISISVYPLRCNKTRERKKERTRTDQ